jgi:hypothetical protein
VLPTSLKSLPAGIRTVGREHLSTPAGAPSRPPCPSSRRSPFDIPHQDAVPARLPHAKGVRVGLELHGSRAQWIEPFAAHDPSVFRALDHPGALGLHGAAMESKTAGDGPYKRPRAPLPSGSGRTSLSAGRTALGAATPRASSTGHAASHVLIEETATGAPI